jgi:hypothetical protein
VDVGSVEDLFEVSFVGVKENHLLIREMKLKSNYGRAVLMHGELEDPPRGCEEEGI